MVKSAVVRKLVIGFGTALTITISLLTNSILSLGGLSRIVVSLLGAVLLYVSVALASAIHRSYPARHDKPKDMESLLTEGPYSLCRHPFYLFMILIQIAIPLTMVSILGILFAVALIPAWIYLIKLEEKELIDYWKDKYLDYMKRVPALIPDFRKIISKRK